MKSSAISCFCFSLVFTLASSQVKPWVKPPPPSCELVTACKCRFPFGLGFDLSMLDPKTIDIPMDSNNTRYLLNPCPSLAPEEEPSAEEARCPKGAALCSVSSSQFTVLALLQNVTFGKNYTGTPTDKDYYVKYSYLDSNNATKDTVLVLKCFYVATNSTIKPIEGNRYELRSAVSCLRRVELTDDDGGLSLGTKLVIIFFVFAGAYLFGGMAILKFIRGASGVEVIPHFEFWSDLPYLVRDGIVFAHNGFPSAATYERI